MARVRAIVMLFLLTTAFVRTGNTNGYCATEGRKTALDAEVVSVNPAKNKIVLKFIRISPLDQCEPDLETVTITVNNKTTYQNINSLASIKAGEGVSVLYIASADNTAIGIALNKSYYQGAIDAQYARQRFDWQRGICGQAVLNQE